MEALTALRVELSALVKKKDRIAALSNAAALAWPLLDRMGLQRPVFAKISRLFAG